MMLLAVNNASWLPWFGLGAAAVLTLIAVFDLAKVPRLAIVELAIAAAGALIAVAGFAGRYRPDAFPGHAGRCWPLTAALTRSQSRAAAQ